MTFSLNIHDPLPKADLSKALICIDLDQNCFICSIIRDIEAGEDAIAVQVTQMSVLLDSSSLATFEDLGEDYAVSDFSIPVEMYKYDAGNWILCQSILMSTSLISTTFLRAQISHVHN